MSALTEIGNSLRSATGNLSFAPSRIVTAPLDASRSVGGEMGHISRSILSPFGNGLLVVPGVATLYLLLTSPSEKDSRVMRFGTAAFAGVAVYAVILGVGVLRGVTGL